MQPFLDSFDASDEREPYRSILSNAVVPQIISALDAEGLSVVVSSDLSAKEQYNALHADDPLLTKLPISEHRFHPNAEAFCVFLEHDGQLVGSVVMRLMWCEPSFGDAMNDLTLLYADPAGMASQEAFAICRPSIAWQKLRSVYISMSSGGHIRRDFRKSIGYEGLWRLARIMALVKWRWSYAVALLEPAAAAKIGFNKYGFQLSSPGVVISDGSVSHEYLLYMSDRDHVRSLLCRREAADLTRGINEISPVEVREALARRGSLRAAE